MTVLELDGDALPRPWRQQLGTRFPQLSAKRHALQPVIDLAAIVASVIAATYLRFEFSLPTRTRDGLLVVVPLFVVVQLLFGAGVGLYARRRAYGSFEETAALAFAVLASTLVVTLVDAMILDRRVPVSACVLAGPTALVAMGAARYVWRLHLDRRLRPDMDRASRVVVFGAGEGGQQLITAMMRNPESPWFPVALLDDDPSMRNLTVKGVRVAGGRSRLAEVAASTRASVLVIAVPSAAAALVRDLSALATTAGLQVRVLPTVTELMDESPGVEDIRPLTEADLLGRHEIEIDVEAVAGYLTGKRVLVTGAGGSIGSELSRQISRFKPAQLVMLDRDESALHVVQLSIDGRAMLDSRNMVVCDVRDRQRVEAVFAEHRPDVVFHAAALKHLPLLQMHPVEAVKTNIWGTQNLLDAASRWGVGRFVNISTDKAAEPESVLGYSKRVTERLTATVAEAAPGTFLSVRFGNVLGSRGSVLTAFRSQIRSGGPVTVTHPDVTRFFMTVEEAVQLVIQAGAVGGRGETLVLDMGEPVNIDEVAHRLIEQADRPIDIEYTGLRNGEKLHEVLLNAEEEDLRPAHPLISHVRVPAMRPGRIDEIRLDGSVQDVITQLRQTCFDAAPDTSPVGGSPEGDGTLAFGDRLVG